MCERLKNMNKRYKIEHMLPFNYDEKFR